MNRPLPPPREGRWRALIWLASGDAFLLSCGTALVLSPLALALWLPSPLWLALLALPSLSWFFYGVMVLRAYAAVPAPASSGIVLEPGRVPVLMEELERLRLACDAPAFTAVHVDADLNASIYQTGSRGGRPQHVLVLGLPLLALLTPRQAAAVIAHEYAHISRLHGHFARWAYVARRRWVALGELHERNHRLITAPIRLFLAWYVPRMMRETLEFSRRCETVADAQAIAVCGGAVAFESQLALALRQRALSRQFWPGVFAQAGGADLARMQPFSRLLEEPAGSRPRDGAQAAVWLHESLCRKPDPRSTHPALRERIGATGVDPGAPLPDRLPWCLDGPSAAAEWLGSEAPRIAAQLDADWRQNAAQGWQDAGEAHAYRHREFSRLLQRRKQQAFDEQDWLQLAQLAETFDQAGVLRAEAIAQGLQRSPADPALLQLKAEDLERDGAIDGAIALWQRIEQDRRSCGYQAHRRLCELNLRAGDAPAAERHRQVADGLWAGEAAEPAAGPAAHAMDASELALLQGRLQPVFQHARAVWLCRDASPGMADSPRWLLYVQAHDGWFMRLVGKLTGEEDFSASACKRLLERLQARLHVSVDVSFIGPGQRLPAGCTEGSLIARAGLAVPAPAVPSENA
ncbi:M48 family metalloprotease [Xanthomonas sp. AmX2]|uniref:M48 family metalloprotease n=1 Tax=Xanthomonas sp. TaxID=29446 RepID=UPI001981CA0F|nr:M48 family metalloprotease [Xanthomonas sp.]MBN6151951.1 M48 family metalloprotease [Xanthomonas sp.]